MPFEKMLDQLGLRVAEDGTNLPPGFRFHPTDEELVSYYLKHKVLDGSLSFHAIGEVDFNKCEPWDLPAKAKMGETRFYFFSLRDRKYPTGMRTNRATEAGYWKATGKDRDVIKSATKKLIGMKKTLVFYMGRAPKGGRTNWIMHEYRLEGESVIEAQNQEWVVCRIFEKNAGGSNKTSPPLIDNDDDGIVCNPESSDNQGSTSSTLPPLQNLELPSPIPVRPNDTYASLTLPDPQPSYYNPSAPIPVQEAILIRSASTARGRRPDLQLGDSLDNLVSVWDTNSLDWTWDVGTYQRQ